jgi:outer membrane lipopolysaccharide assembly protein LptE/RlpB
MRSGAYSRAGGCFLAASALLLSACGYHVEGQSGLLPKDVHTIAIAPWTNTSIHYQLSNYLAASVSREFISSTRYRIVSDRSKADVVFYGTVANMTEGATLYDNATGRTTGGQTTVMIQFRLVDRTGKVLISKPNMEFHQPYEVSENPTQYFDESEASIKRLSDDVAKTVVSSILSQF